MTIIFYYKYEVFSIPLDKSYKYKVTFSEAILL